MTYHIFRTFPFLQRNDLAVGVESWMYDVKCDTKTNTNLVRGARKLSWFTDVICLKYRKRLNVYRKVQDSILSLSRIGYVACLLTWTRNENWNSCTRKWDDIKIILAMTNISIYSPFLGKLWHGGSSCHPLDIYFFF